MWKLLLILLILRYVTQYKRPPGLVMMLLCGKQTHSQTLSDKKSDTVRVSWLVRHCTHSLRVRKYVDHSNLISQRVILYHNIACFTDMLLVSHWIPYIKHSFRMDLYITVMVWGQFFCLLCASHVKMFGSILMCMFWIFLVGLNSIFAILCFLIHHIRKLNYTVILLKALFFKPLEIWDICYTHHCSVWDEKRVKY